MKTIRIANGEIQASEISLGCMRLPGLSGKEAEVFVQTALDEGINFFDHADIYAGGKSEELFARAIHIVRLSVKKYCSRQNVAYASTMEATFTMIFLKSIFWNRSMAA